MCWFVLTHLVVLLVDLLSVRRRPDRDRHLQLLLLQRQRPQSRLSPWEKLTLAVLASKLARLTAGCTAQPTATWVTHQALQLSWQLQDGEVAARYLLHDRDGKLAPSFDAVFRTEGVEVVYTPYRAPPANAIAGRWVGSVRRECLDHLLIVNEGQLRRVLSAYVARYNQARPHQGLEQRTPLPSTERAGQGPIRRRELLGGLLREYYRAAA